MRAKDRFKVGDRVRATPASKNLFRDWTKERGVFKGFGRASVFIVRVLRDHQKTATSYHEKFWEHE